MSFPILTALHHLPNINDHFISIEARSAQILQDLNNDVNTYVEVIQKYITQQPETKQEIFEIIKSSLESGCFLQSLFSYSDSEEEEEEEELYNAINELAQLVNHSEAYIIINYTPASMMLDHHLSTFQEKLCIKIHELFEGTYSADFIDKKNYILSLSDIKKLLKLDSIDLHPLIAKLLILTFNNQKFVHGLQQLQHSNLYFKPLSIMIQKTHSEPIQINFENLYRDLLIVSFALRKSSVNQDGSAQLTIDSYKFNHLYKIILLTECITGLQPQYPCERIINCRNNYHEETYLKADANIQILVENPGLISSWLAIAKLMHIDEYDIIFKKDFNDLFQNENLNKICPILNPEYSAEDLFKYAVSYLTQSSPQYRVFQIIKKYCNNIQIKSILEDFEKYMLELDITPQNVLIEDSNSIDAPPAKRVKRETMLQR